MSEPASGEAGRAEKALQDLNAFALSTFTVTLFRFGIRLLKNVVFTRLLGPVERGVFGLLTTVPELTVSLGNLGFGLGSTYLVAKRRVALRPVLANTLLVTAALGTLLAGAGFLAFAGVGFPGAERGLLERYVPFVVAVIPLVLLQRFTEDLLVATKQIHFVNLQKAVFSGLPVVLVVALWLATGKPLLAAVGAWAGMLAVVGLWSLRRLVSGSEGPWTPSLPCARESFSYGMRGYVSILANALSRRVDVLLIASMAGAEALGYYTVAVSVTEIMLAVPEAFGRPFLPIHFGLGERDAERLTPLVVRFVLLIMLLVSLGVAVTGKLVILVLYGREFLPALDAMLLLLPGVLSLSVYQFLKVDLYKRNLPGLVSWNALLAMACNVGLNLLLIPAWGIAGASVSSSVSYTLSTAVLLAAYVRRSGIPLREVLVPRRQDLALFWSHLRGR
jgi:O-antigen/teichoic acid export membrane protein